ncbi:MULTISPECIES: PEP-CTERM sorting domain-containing protein [unclassified Massilia]|uniref:PEP-CTERM sorting domain-containing protein n=1 Tax=unclassified Massilia TaxID=2609279 RepID=UPI0009E71000|nr:MULTISPECIES: PEP-CTERM sorting domain-containing protein [unclassified Massilia]
MFKKYLTIALIALVTLPSYATVITYKTQLTTGNNYTTTYTVTPSPDELPISEFTIYFDYNSYANLVLSSSPAGFDSLLVQPDTALPSDGFLDVLALTGGIVFTSPQGGFSVSYLYTGTGTPGSQRFDIIDSTTFETISSGFTSASSPNDIPEPGTLALFTLGAAGISCLTRRSRTKLKTLPKRA